MTRFGRYAVSKAVAHGWWNRTFRTPESWGIFEGMGRLNRFRLGWLFPPFFAATGASYGEQAQSPPAGQTTDQRLQAECPHAVASQIESQKSDARHHRPPSVTAATRPALRQDLLLRARLDQEAREFLRGQQDMPSEMDPRVRWMHNVDADNLTRLRHIVRQDGFPTAETVGYDGVSAAWLLLQHAGADPGFQASLLPTIERLVQRGELGTQSYALLADRVLLAQGRKQRFGTQFTGLGEHMKMQPLEDPLHVDQRRARLGLPPLADYICFLRVFYGR